MTKEGSPILEGVFHLGKHPPYQRIGLVVHLWSNMEAKKTNLWEMFNMDFTKVGGSMILHKPPFGVPCQFAECGWGGVRPGKKLHAMERAILHISLRP